jgi:hypothetical protein
MPSIEPMGCQESFLRLSGHVTARPWCAVVCCRPLEVLVVWSFVYLALRRVLELMVLCWQWADANEVEILVLRHQLAVLRR